MRVHPWRDCYSVGLKVREDLALEGKNERQHSLSFYLAKRRKKEQVNGERVDLYRRRKKTDALPLSV